MSQLAREIQEQPGVIRRLLQAERDAAPGGAKSIMPGVSWIESITRNHALLLSPRAIARRAVGNPVREDIEEAARWQA